ncbi:MAG: endonuclease domain-containing protein [Phenylobacterium sp.]|nr:MAG: endonuclease domain-containing protein [Phenylobacterium sp.]
MFLTSPAKRREGDRSPSAAKSGWWRGRAAGTALRRTVITNRARAMRKAMTEPEVILWSRLRGRGGEQPTFRRQHPFGSIILDFYCPALKLALEVDGAAHWDDDAQLRDAARDHWLARQGVQVMRIPASRVYHDLDGVMDEVLLKIEALKRSRTS